ncbi:lysophospholipase [Saccharomonospora marina XMU15]|uniref:Lysophospholipase n=1 Tax=Saccharomonospora marina XMU15 TaxID=882083 RepID=H5X7N3_9PSEU|nr:alpha/beta hydrolase [Saccharomonospora marina]EHR51325.1 lysophospholipase [Saccharomonospora marina XMU15]
MPADDYARFLPAHHRARAAASTPNSTWWEWRGRRVHILRATNPDAPVRLLVIHGAGGHAAALWPFIGLVDDMADALLPDLPLYGDTIDPDPAGVRYDAWVELLCDLVSVERAADARPLVLFGASMGGMLAYEVAARTREVAAVAATCLLDPRDPDALRAAARFSIAGGVAPAVLGSIARLAGRVRLPIRRLVDMRKMSNQPALSALCSADPRGGVRVPIGFLSSFLRFAHTPPEDFDAAPVLLVHPAEDRWIPPEVSARFLARINGDTSLVLLDNCGHFPAEEPGLTLLIDALRSLQGAA